MDDINEQRRQRIVATTYSNIGIDHQLQSG